MEHVAKTSQGNDQWRLIAENGWLLRSKKSGNTYKTIDTRNLKLWEVVEDPDFVKPEVKAEEKPAETLSKPKATKRRISKSK